MLLYIKTHRYYIEALNQRVNILPTNINFVLKTSPTDLHNSKGHLTIQIYYMYKARRMMECFVGFLPENSTTLFDIIMKGFDGFCLMLNNFTR